ncbi:M14 family metallopeptidase [Falsibacillus albus]|uniref:DUF2817 domain-containing protein n=1 Tax=Falsibacillus albus TaxID=2478915 RepID=A0A3L7JX95_9BACI|nr:M14 family metallopeptidase [Falsibacillus albus]RLQ95376.1 DUF2817 domain-containing protein [Falsibacillus albus]
MNQLFTETYEQSKEEFWRKEEKLKKKWSEVDRESINVCDDQTLTLDLIHCKANLSKRALVITTGLHGIEGYVGSAMMNLFIERFSGMLDEMDTSLILMHAINPWGMKYFRKVNEHNVDLNRNFIFNRETDDLSNESYVKAKSLLEPKGGLGWFEFGSRLLKTMMSMNKKELTAAVTMGQYINKEGVYYGGDRCESATVYLQDYFQKFFLMYDQVVLLDMHTGYGPSKQMHLVNSRFDDESPDFWKQALKYPYISETTADSFYKINGDMIDFLYQFKNQVSPSTKLFATTFEFGTLGETLLAQLQSLKTTIEENAAYFYGDRKSRDKTRECLKKLYDPNDSSWREKAVRDAIQAFEGIIHTFFEDGSWPQSLPKKSKI